MDKNEKSIETTDKYFFQYLVAFSASLLSFSVNVAYGWTSPTLPLLMDPVTSPIPITSDEGSWIVAMYVIGTIVITIPVAYSMEKLGRKITLLLGAVPLVIGWILIGVSQSVSVIYVARVLCGFTHGLSYSVLPMYLAEIASDKVRGSITIMLTIMAKFGILCSYAIGSYIDYRTMAWIGMAPPIVFVIVFVWLPDSPYFLIGKNRDKAALNSLEKLRGRKDVQSEYEMMHSAVRKSEENKGTFKEIMSRDNLHALVIILGLAAVQQLCGSQAVISYAQIIFDEVGSDLGGAESTIVLAFVQLAAAALSSVTVDKFGRKPLLLFSVLAPAICNTVVGVYFYLRANDTDVSGLAWLPMTAIMIFIVAYSLGLASVAFVVLGEVFPKNLRATAGAIFTIFASAIGFGVAKMFQIVSDNIGIHATFWIFAGFSYVFVPFIWFVLPETKGKSLDTILEELRPKKK